ncbi:unnamed protein product [Mytilus coruscus]|uniref:TRIM2_3 n=1 Tax=Mytilus coruscus TaxID=42192 RepID=A0A6J8C8I3_MYTCO|nr:unnamed protein product [Mytilus coruscus]
MSPFFSVLENNIIDIIEELEDIIKDRENNKLEIEQQKIEILDTVKDLENALMLSLTRPFDIAVIGNDKLALGFPWSTRKRIEMINATNNRSEHEIFFKNKCFGISYDKGRLFAIAKNEGILIMDLCGQLWSFLPIEGEGIFYIHVKNDRLYCSDNCNDTVQCYDMKGCALWTYKHSNLRSPMSISSNENPIFIAGCKSNIIVSTNMNGIIAKVICNRNHGIKDPTSVYFEKHHLLMCNGKNAQAFLYKEN